MDAKGWLVVTGGELLVQSPLGTALQFYLRSAGSGLRRSAAQVDEIGDSRLPPQIYSNDARPHLRARKFPPSLKITATRKMGERWESFVQNFITIYHKLFRTLANSGQLIDFSATPASLYLCGLRRDRLGRKKRAGEGNRTLVAISIHGLYVSCCFRT
jgi:hypothetical protein